MASGVVACAAFGTIFLLVKLFPMMLSQLGQHGTYLFFAAVCIVLILFTHLFVPETRWVRLFLEFFDTVLNRLFFFSVENLWPSCKRSFKTHRKLDIVEKWFHWEKILLKPKIPKSIKMKKVVNPILKLVQSVPFLFQHQCLSNIHALVFWAYSSTRRNRLIGKYFVVLFWAKIQVLADDICSGFI